MKTSMYRIIIITIVGGLVGLPLPCFCAPSEWVQWDVSSGGNGHWYKAVPGFSGLTWTVASQQAQAEGGYLATITSAAENAFVFSLVSDDLRFWNGGNWSGPALGGFHPDGSHDRASGWCWVTGEPWTYSNWWYSQPDQGWPIEDRMSFYGAGFGRPGGPGPMWNDLHRDNTNLGGYVIESTPLMETSSFQSTLVETLFGHQAILQNGTVSGGLNGIFIFNGFETVTISTGPWSGKGFSRGQCQLTLEGATYTGDWKGMLFVKPQEHKIYLKGATSGGISATVEGYLTESVPDSGVYDQYQATWKIGRLSDIDTSATVNLNGTLTYQNSSEFPNTPLYILQSSIEGTLSGHYAGPLSAVINHIRIADIDNPYYGEGFSIISYVSESGQGEGWTYNKVISPGVVKIKGLFDSPLFGIVSGTLDETKIPRTLFATIIERIDLGLPPMADLEVTTWGPTRVSPGQTMDYITEYRNEGLSNAYDTVVVVQLPAEVEYISSTNGGIYRWQTHEVIWKLGTIAPKTKGNLAPTVKVQWGLPWGTQLQIPAMIDTTGAEIDKHLAGFSPLPAILQYLAYEPVYLISNKMLTPEEFAEELEDPTYADIYVYAQELGYEYTNVTGDIRYSNGSQIIYAVMVSAEKILLATKTTLSDGAVSSLLIEIGEKDISLIDREGGMKINIETREISSLGESWQLTLDCCVANCVSEWFPSLNYYTGAFTTANECRKAFLKIRDGTALWKCIKGFAGILTDIFGAPYMGFVGGMTLCVPECVVNPSLYICPNCTWRGYCSMDHKSQVKEHCVECSWVGRIGTSGTSEHYLVTRCDSDQTCVGYVLLDGPRDYTGFEGCVPKNEVPNTGSHTQTVALARDPNRKLGPDGRVLPGQTLNYMVEYENEGEGIAFGVYFTDTLDQDLDDSTLQIGPVFDVHTGSEIALPGIYNPATRTITWFVGEVGPGQGGITAFDINVTDDAEDGTEIINFATVYFPSVPEATRTNGVVSIVTPFGDIDQDGDVDFGDYAVLANQWLQLPVVPSADIAPNSGDGIVDFRDLALLADHWLEGAQLAEHDLCPDDPNKVEPGTCGCGVPDIDVNGDGIPDCGFRYGDVNGDAEITAYDAALTLQCETLSEIQKFAADVDGNGCVSSEDADLIAQYAVGLITVFPVELMNPKPATPPTCGCP